MDASKLYFRALRRISKDEEIFITYIDASYPFYDRQKTLQDEYHFKCICTLCQTGTKALQDSFLQPFSKAPKSFQESSEAYLTHHADIPDLGRYLNFDASSAYLVAAETEAHAKLREANSSQPSVQITLLESLCRSLHDSKIWPVYRVPYVEARQDLIEVLISQDRRGDALTHLAKLYFADLIRFRHHHHPRRVVNVILFFKLLVYDCMTSDSPMTLPFDVTAALVEIGKDALDNVVKSHGQESSLTASVVKKFREVYVEIAEKDKGALENSRRNIALRDLKAYADGLQL
jgi:SET and MYND domain-containing protein